MDSIKVKIQRFTSGNYSFNDYLSLSVGLKHEEIEKDIITSMEDDWNETQYTSTQANRLSKILVKLHHQMETRNQPKLHTIRQFYPLFSKIAAILIIPALITISILTYFTINVMENEESWAEIHAPLGSRTKFKLPDGSQGWLNSGSTLKYALDFHKARVVQLSGEAFFDVIHQDEKQFVVETKYLDVEVKGTSFDVAAYNDEENIDVLLEKGAVLLKDKQSAHFVEMKPNEQVSYSVAKQSFTKTKVAALSFSAWKEGKLILRNASLAELAKQLSRWYNVETKIQNEQNIVCQFRATFEDENLPEVLRLLKLSSNLDYTIDERVKQADGTFSKQHVLLKVKQ